MLGLLRNSGFFSRLTQRVSAFRPLEVGTFNKTRNSSGNEIANANFYAVRSGSYRIQ